MKKLLVLLCLLMTKQILPAQEQYRVDGESYELKVEVTGTLTLLWTVINKQYRYFVKQKSSLVELKNTRGADNKFQEEYKETLMHLMSYSIRTDNLKFTLPELKKIINQYNASVDPSYEIEEGRIKLGSLLSFFGGVTNHPYISNPNNSVVPQIGVEIEVFEAESILRHSLFLT